jgi:phage head maturation protease
MADLGERRTFGRAIELRAADNTVDVSGHAAVFNQEADICGMFREIIMPGAFRSTIMQDDVPLLIEHEGLPLARSTMGRGTLKLAEDDVGLRVDSSLDATGPRRDARRAEDAAGRSQQDELRLHGDTTGVGRHRRHAAAPHLGVPALRRLDRDHAGL